MSKSFREKIMQSGILKAQLAFQEKPKESRAKVMESGLLKSDNPNSGAADPSKAEYDEEIRKAYNLNKQKAMQRQAKKAESGALKGDNVFQGEASQRKPKASEAHPKTEEPKENETLQEEVDQTHARRANWDIAIEKIRERAAEHMRRKAEQQDQTKKTSQEKGLARICGIAEANKVITKNDVRIFLNDLGLPRMGSKVLDSKMKKAGASELGFYGLENFFVFVKNEVRNFSFEETIEAFKAFDENDENVIDLLHLRSIVSLLGDVLSHEEVDDIMRRADMDGDGSVTYEEITKHVFGGAQQKPYSCNAGRKTSLRKGSTSSNQRLDSVS